MTGNSFAFESSGPGAWAGKHHHHHHHHRDADDEIRHGGGGRHGRHGGGPRGGRAAKAQFARELARQWAFARGKEGSGLGRPSPEELEELIALRRMGGGPFGGPGPFGPRGRGRGRGGRRRRGDVRLAVLRLLADEPSNGYQLMQAIEERSGGRWRPSPGSMYPTLAQLEDEGFVRVVEGSNPKLIEITDAGRSHLETRGGEPDPWASDDGDEDGLIELAPLVIGLGKAAWQVASVGSESQRARAVELLSEARRSLYGILAEDSEGAQSGDADRDDGPSPEDDEPSTTV